MHDSTLIALAPPDAALPDYSAREWSPTSSATWEAADAPVVRPNFRRLVPLADGSVGLTRGQRALGAAVAVAIAVAYFVMVLQYWAPAHNGVDQNGYLVGGKMLARTGSTGLKPAEPLGFVGAMWVRNETTGVSYPKYPVGLPLLYAVVLWTCGPVAKSAAFLVSPVGAAAAVLGTYFLARRFAGPFASVLAMLVLGFSQVTLVLANNPNSHMSCLAFVVWGVFLLVRFWETGSVWRGLLAGFLIGFAATIRYTDGLLGLLVGVVVLSSLVWRNWRSFARCLTPVIGWLIPVAYLVTFNLVAMHTPTGYDTTNESQPGKSFTLEHVGQNWEKLVRQVHDTGLFFTLPLGILGMALAYRAGWRRATLLWLWLVPGTLTYMAYYWAPERGVAYLRFFTTLLPPLAVGVAVVVDQQIASAVTLGQRIATPLAGGVVVAVAVAMSTYRAVFGLEDGQESGQSMESQYRMQVNLAGLSRVVTSVVPAGSTLLAPTTQLNDLQFAGDYDCFSTETFNTSFAQRLRGQENNHDADNDPDPQQPARRRFLLTQLEGKSNDDLAAMESGIVRRALDGGRRVFLLVRQDQAANLTRAFGRRDSGLTWGVRGYFHDLPRLHDPDAATPNPTDPRPRNPDRVRGGGGPGGGPGAGPGGGFGGGFGRGFGGLGGGRQRGPAFEATPAAWQVLEITKKAKA